MSPYLLTRLFPPHAFRFGGGGSTGAQQVASAPAPAAVAPVTSTNAEVLQAQQDLRRQSLQKRGFYKSTLFAGDTGGYKPPSPTSSALPGPAPATKLGG